MKIHGLSPKLEALTSLVASIGEGRPFTAVATVEGVESRDFMVPRTIEPGAVRLDQIPFPLLKDHDPTQVIGRVDRMYRLIDADAETVMRAVDESPDLRLIDPRNVWIAEGAFATNDLGLEMSQMVAGKFTRGVSVGAGQARGRTDQGDFDEFDPEVIGPMAYAFFTDFQVVELSVTAKQAIGPSVIWMSDVPYTDTAPSDQPTESALVASGRLSRQNDFLLYPKDEWFSVAGLPRSIPAHISISGEGHIVSWLAKFDVAHGNSSSNKKIFVPREPDGHSGFHLKNCITETDKVVRTGVITAYTSHARKELGASETEAHYDHTGYQVADVVVLDVGKGYVVSGAMRTTVSEEDVRALRGSNLSGDWRKDPNTGRLRLRAVMACNAPGFEPSDIFSVTEDSLVASFTLDADPYLDLEIDVMELEINSLMA